MTQEPWLVPKDFYDMIMALPDGADVSEFFEFEDPQWNTMKVTLFKTEGDDALLSVNSLLAMEPAPTEGEQQDPS